jgi:ribosome-associated heat shock protein Hsp15
MRVVGTTSDAVRVDRWLWAVRAYKTRSASSAACAGGHVSVNGQPAKPATRVRAGDEVTALTPGGPRLLEVVQLLEKRVGAVAAAEAMIDRSPARPEADRQAPPLARDRGAGRPTKRDRRAIERFRGR